jgi:hypothetical protein
MRDVNVTDDPMTIQSAFSIETDEEEEEEIEDSDKSNPFQERGNARKR